VPCIVVSPFTRIGAKNGTTPTATTPTTGKPGIALADYAPAAVAGSDAPDSWATLASSPLMRGWPTSPIGV
jgi:hypothetical protein